MTSEVLALIEQLAEDLGIDPEFEYDTAGEALLRFVEEHGLTLVENDLRPCRSLLQREVLANRAF